MVYAVSKKRIKMKTAFYCKLCIVLICSLWFVACRHDGRVSNSAKFTNIKHVTPKQTVINGHGVLNDILYLENYYLIHNDIKQEGNQLSVYDKRTNKFLYSFAAKGHGENETIAMDMIQTYHGDTLEIIDQAKYKIIKYVIGRKQANMLNKKFLSFANSGPLQEVYRLNDSILIFSTLDARLITYNDSKNKIVSECNFCDSLGIPRELNEQVKFHFSCFNNQLCIGFRHINSILIGNVDNGIIKIPELKNLEEQARVADVEMIYYVYVDISENFVLGQYMGYKPGFIEKVAGNYSSYSPKFELEVYTKDLKAYQHIQTTTDVLRCKLSKDSNEIYSWNPLASESNIVRVSF